MRLCERTDQIPKIYRPNIRWYKMKSVLQFFQVDQGKLSFGHNSLDLKRIITKFCQMNLLVKNFRMQAWLLRKSVTIATNAEVYNCVIFCPIEGKLGGCFSTVERTSTSLVVWWVAMETWLPWQQ